MNMLDLAMAVGLISIAFWSHVVVKKIDALNVLLEKNVDRKENSQAAFIAPDQPAPLFEIYNARNGEKTTSSRLLKGGALMIIFSPQCPKCQKEIKVWMQTRKKWTAAGLSLVLVAIESQSNSKDVVEFVNRQDVDQDVFITDFASEFMKNYNRLNRIPAFYMIFDGTVVFSGEIDDMNWKTLSMEVESKWQHRLSSAKKFA